MANEKKTAAATKKRGRPPGTKRAGSARGKSASKRPGPERPKAAAAGHVLISKKTLKGFHKRIANLEAALGSFANALRVLE